VSQLLRKRNTFLSHNIFSVAKNGALRERAMQEPFLKRCHNDVTSMFKPHRTPFHGMLACVVRLAWSAALVFDYSLPVPSSHRAILFCQKDHKSAISFELEWMSQY